MRRSVAGLLALFVTCSSAGSQACDCIDHPRPVKHRVAVHRTWHRHFAARAYVGCPIALAHEIRAGCNSYYETYVDLR